MLAKKIDDFDYKLSPDTSNAKGVNVAFWLTVPLEVVPDMELYIHF